MTDELRSVINRDHMLIPNTEHQNNQRKLSELIYKLKSFSLEELQEGCVREGIGIFDSHQTLKDYLDELVFLGLLKYEWNRYSFKE